MVMSSCNCNRETSAFYLLPGKFHLAKQTSYLTCVYLCSSADKLLLRALRVSVVNLVQRKFF